LEVLLTRVERILRRKFRKVEKIGGYEDRFVWFLDDRYIFIAHIDPGALHVSADLIDLLGPAVPTEKVLWLILHVRVIGNAVSVHDDMFFLAKPHRFDMDKLFKRYEEVEKKFLELLEEMRGTIEVEAPIHRDIMSLLFRLLLQHPRLLFTNLPCIFIAWHLL